MAKNGTTVYAAVGRRLSRYALDAEGGSLALRGTFALPEGLQYLWPNRSGSLLFAACSDGRPGFKGSRHCACTLAVAPGGDLSLVGEPIALRARPVHISTDQNARYAVVTYPAPSGISVHAIGDDGGLGPELAQPPMPALAKTAHQALFTPDNRRVVLPLRGNHAEPDKAEDPGALEIFDFDNGRLRHSQSIAPNGGLGFGPRHVDFHPTQPWMYMSIERENEIALFRMGDRFEGPVVRASTLAHPEAEKPRQLVGAIHVHPNGRYVYVSNRADGTVEHGGRKVFNGGENSIAVFEIDPKDGAPRRIQNAETRAMHPRTFHIDPTGRILVAANMTTRDVLEGGEVRNVPGGLTLFRVGDDGRLTFLRAYDEDVTKDHLFWVGMAKER